MHFQGSHCLYKGKEDIWAIVVLVATGCQTCSLSAEWTRNICVYMCYYLVYIKSHECTLITPILVQHHSVYFSSLCFACFCNSLLWLRNLSAITQQLAQLSFLWPVFWHTSLRLAWACCYHSTLLSPLLTPGKEGKRRKLVFPHTHHPSFLRHAQKPQNFFLTLKIYFLSFYSLLLCRYSFLSGDKVNRL